MRICVIFLASLLMIYSSAVSEEFPFTPDNEMMIGQVIPILDSESDEILCRYPDSDETLIYYDGTPYLYDPNVTEIGRKWAVRFTPIQTCSLSSVYIASYDRPGMGRIHVWSDDGNGYPDTNLIEPFDCQLLGNLTYQRIEIDPPIDLRDNEFHAGWEYIQTPPPYATTDMYNNIDDRSKSFSPDDSTWEVWSHNLNIRAGVIYYGEDNVPPEISHNPVSISYADGDPTIISAEVTDNNGISSVRVVYSTEEYGSDSLEMVNIGGDTYQVEMPRMPVGTTVYYFIRAVDLPPSYNMSRYPADGTISYPVVRGEGIAYDDGIPEQWLYANRQWDSNAFAVRFTPDRYPVRVLMLRVMVGGIHPFNLDVRNFDGNQPGISIAGPWRVLSRGATWVNFEVPENEYILIEEGDFCIVFHWLEPYPDFITVGADRTDPDGRSYKRFGQWSLTPNYDYIIQAVVDYYDQDQLACSTYCYTPVVPANNGLIEWSLTITNIGDTVIWPIYARLTPMIEGCQGTPYPPWAIIRWITYYLMPGFSFTGEYSMPVNGISGIQYGGCQFDFRAIPREILCSCCFDFEFYYPQFGSRGNPQWPECEWYERTLPANLPVETELMNAYPNPFNAKTTISFGLSEPGPVRLDVYNLNGQLVETLINEHRNSGRHEIAWNASGYSSGIYFYKLIAGERSFTRRMTLLK